MTPVGGAMTPVGAATGPVHLARLGLDLQVDGLLFAVSAAAGARRPGQGAEPGPPAQLWRRWLQEDLDAVLELAAVVAEGGGDLPAPVGGAARRPHLVLEDLRARYRTLLQMTREAAADAGADPPARLVRLAGHYESRLRHLDRLEHGPAAGAVPAAGVGVGVGAAVRPAGAVPPAAPPRTPACVAGGSVQERARRHPGRAGTVGTRPS